MKNNELNKSLCEELFGGEFNVVEKPKSGKSYVRRFRVEILFYNKEERELIKNLKEVVLETQKFFSSKKKYVPTHRAALANWLNGSFTL